jgi:tetratricopeptide (TPR) repeat protein
MNTPEQTASPPPNKATQDRIRGVFSSQEIRKVGTGTTTRKTVYKAFHFVEQTADGGIEYQTLNVNYVPSGPKRKMSMEDLIERFSPEPEFYLNSVYPKMQELQRAIENADAHREKNETFAAEHEYGAALAVDDENVRANFGIGLTYMQRGETGKADDIFERLVKLDAAFTPEHKHMFNEFGINLRRSKMYNQAVVYYKRAMDLTVNDENLRVNLARALFESKDIQGCTEQLVAALNLAPGCDPATKFLNWLMEKKLVPADMLERARQALSQDAASPPGAPAEQSAEKDAPPKNTAEPEAP